MQSSTIDRTLVPSAPLLNKVPFPQIQEHRLANGIPVYTSRFGGQDVVELSLIFPAGRCFETKTSVASFTSKMIQEGTQTHSALEFARQLDFFGASIQVESGFEVAVVGLTCLTKHLASTLPLVQDMLLAPLFAQAELENLRLRTLQHFDLEEKKTEFNARKYFNRMLFGDAHPYGRHAERADVEAIQMEDLVAFHRRFYNLANAKVVVCGQYDPKQLLGLLENFIGQAAHIDPAMRVSESESHGTVLDAAPARKFYYHEMQDSMQSTIRVGHRGFTRQHPDHHGMQVVNTILGGYFGSRLMKNIREDKGYTYGIGSGWLPMKYHGLFIIQTDVGNAYIRPTLTEIDKEIQLLLDKGVTEAELSLVKNYMLGKSVSGRETPGQIAGSIRNMLINDLPFSQLDDKFEQIQAITVEQVNRLANQWLHPENLLQVVAGKMPEE